MVKSPPSGSVTEWIAKLKAGDQQDAAGELLQRYFHRLAALASGLMDGVPSRRTDDEQAAVDAFWDLLQGVKENRFPDLYDRHDLWQILFDLTEKRSVSQMRHQTRQKRDWHRTDGESAIGCGAVGSKAGWGAANLKAPEPTPDFTAACAEKYQRLLAELDAKDVNGTLRRIAVMKLQGYSNDEIAKHCNVTNRTIERRLRRIRGIWEIFPT